MLSDFSLVLKKIQTIIQISKVNSTASATEESPVIILPGTSEILPDEEIIIENPEEEPEETLIAVPDLRDDSDKQKTS